MISDKFKLNFTFITNILYISLLFFGAIIWADTNGVWHNAADITNGTFALDEGSNTNSFTFINPVKINNSLVVNGYTTSKDPILGNQTATKNYTDQYVDDTAIYCQQQGLILNGTQCIYAAGIDFTPDTFTFTDVNNVEPNTTIYSNEITLSGFLGNLILYLKNNSTQVSIIKNGIDQNRTDVVVKRGDKIKIRMNSSHNFLDSNSVKINLSSYQTIWGITTREPIPRGTIYYPASGNPANGTNIEPTYSGGNSGNPNYSHGLYETYVSQGGTSYYMKFASFTYTGYPETRGIIKTVGTNSFVETDTGDPVLSYAQLAFYQDDVLVWQTYWNNPTNYGVGVPRSESYGGSGIRGWYIPNQDINLSAYGIDFSGTHTYYFVFQTSASERKQSGFYLDLTT